MKLVPLSLVLAATTACLSMDDPVTAEEASALRVGDGFRIQAGSQLIVYGVTDDDFAIYQDGPTVYATRLFPGAPRHVVAEVGATQPLVLVRGRVAFVWTELAYFGPGGVSPLVVWTSAAGPKLATDSSVGSVAATRGATVSPDGREILFLASVDAAGAIGDIVSASPDLSHRRTLVAGVNVNFSATGTCPPLVGFDGAPQRTVVREPGSQPSGGSPVGTRTRRSGRAFHPVAAYCPGAATVATLSRWVRGARTDLSTSIALPPRWSSDAAGARFVSIDAATRFPVSIDAGGAATVLEEVPVIQDFMNQDGNPVVVATTPSGNQLHRIVGAPPRVDVVADLAAGFYYTGRFDMAFRQYTDSPMSPDGKLMLFATGADPNTGFTDLNLVDVTANPPAVQNLQPIGRGQPAFEMFTADSSHALYYMVDGVSPNSTLFAASLAGDNRQVSSGTPTEFVFFGLRDSEVVYSDHMNGTGIGMFDLHDLMLADVGADRIAPRLLAGQVYNLFFPTRDRRWVLYTSDSDPHGAGLLAVRAR
jgi:hypothetical protein